jgi:hypothetical protein
LLGRASRRPEPAIETRQSPMIGSTIGSLILLALSVLLLVLIGERRVRGVPSETT